ncbi:MAG: FecR domain-containing protein [Opitutaceae bacterium]|nr:FecR domain-containing protein [Opitutaceae bacterium]
MNNPAATPPRDPEFRAIEEKAAEWFGRVEIGLTAREEREFLRWLKSDPRHGEAMREMDETWEFLDGLKEVPRWRSLASSTARPRSIPAFAPLLAGLAAVVALAVFTPWQPWRGVAGVQHAVSLEGGMKKVELPDGSVVHLNAGSSVRVHYSSSQRQVELRHGEAHFSVAKDVNRPFVVTARDVAVKAVGTAFNVRLETAGVEVFVTEGKVRLDDADKGGSLLPRPQAAGSIAPSTVPAAETELLVAGQRAVVPLAPAAASSPVAPSLAVVGAIAPTEIQQALAWQGLQLDFDQMPLAQVVADFNRHNSHQLVIADPDLAQHTFGGSFRADNVEGFVQLLEERFEVAAERSRDKTVLRRR